MPLKAPAEPWLSFLNDLDAQLEEATESIFSSADLLSFRRMDSKGLRLTLMCFALRLITAARASLSWPEKSLHSA